MKALIFALTLVSCTTSSSYYEHPPMEWVEPLIFEHNLRTCRSQDTCRAESLFNG